MYQGVYDTNKKMYNILRNFCQCDDDKMISGGGEIVPDMLKGIAQIGKNYKKSIVFLMELNKIKRLIENKNALSFDQIIEEVKQILTGPSAVNFTTVYVVGLIKENEDASIEVKNVLMFLTEMIFDVFLKNIITMMQKMLTGITIIEKIMENMEVISYSFDILNGLFDDIFVREIAKGSLLMSAYKIFDDDQKSELTQHITELIKIMKMYKGSYSIIEMLNHITMTIMRTGINNITDHIRILEKKYDFKNNMENIRKYQTQLTDQRIGELTDQIEELTESLGTRQHSYEKQREENEDKVRITLVPMFSEINGCLINEQCTDKCKLHEYVPNIIMSYFKKKERFCYPEEYGNIIDFIRENIDEKSRMIDIDKININKMMQFNDMFDNELKQQIKNVNETNVQITEIAEMINEKRIAIENLKNGKFETEWINEIIDGIEYGDIDDLIQKTIIYILTTKKFVIPQINVEIDNVCHKKIYELIGLCAEKTKKLTIKFMIKLGRDVGNIAADNIFVNSRYYSAIGNLSGYVIKKLSDGSRSQKDSKLSRFLVSAVSTSGSITYDFFHHGNNTHDIWAIALYMFNMIWLSGSSSGSIDYMTESIYGDTRMNNELIVNDFIIDFINICQEVMNISPNENHIMEKMSILKDHLNAGNKTTANIFKMFGFTLVSSVTLIKILPVIYDIVTNLTSGSLPSMSTNIYISVGIWETVQILRRQNGYSDIDQLMQNLEKGRTINSNSISISISISIKRLQYYQYILSGSNTLKEYSLSGRDKQLEHEVLEQEMKQDDIFKKYVIDKKQFEQDRLSGQKCIHHNEHDCQQDAEKCTWSGDMKRNFGTSIQQSFCYPDELTGKFRGKWQNKLWNDDPQAQKHLNALAESQYYDNMFDMITKLKQKPESELTHSDKKILIDYGNAMNPNDLRIKVLEITFHDRRDDIVKISNELNDLLKNIEYFPPMPRLENNQIIITQRINGNTTIRYIGIKKFEEGYIRFLDGI
jgi:hypothetical protein